MNFKQALSNCLIFASVLTIAPLYKLIAASLMMLAMLAQTFSKAFIVAGYYTNTGAYAKNCENKAKPKMHCNGKCQMMKKIQAEEKKNEESPNRKTDNKGDIQFFEQLHTNINTTIALRPIKNTPLSYQNKTTVDRQFDIFHPPQA